MQVLTNRPEAGTALNKQATVEGFAIL